MKKIQSDITKVRYREDGAKRAKSMLLKGMSEITIFGQPAIAGKVVNKEGDYNNKIHAIMTELVIDTIPMVWNTHYGILEEGEK